MSPILRVLIGECDLFPYMVHSTLFAFCYKDSTSPVSLNQRQVPMAIQTPCKAKWHHVDPSLGALNNTLLLQASRYGHCQRPVIILIVIRRREGRTWSTAFTTMRGSPF